MPKCKSKSAWLALAVAMLLSACAEPEQVAPEPEPLPSWQPGPTRDRLLQFITEADDRDSPNWIEPDARIAVFDHDGTLVAERPRLLQTEFIYARIRELAPQHPEWTTEQPFRAVLDRDYAWLDEQGMGALGPLMNAAQADTSMDDFEAAAKAFWAAARDPDSGRPFSPRVYQPMVELIELLHTHRFKVFIVSSGGGEFIRAFSEQAYGVPRERVIGSRMQSALREEDGRLQIWRLPGMRQMNIGPMKALNVRMITGRRPVMAVGNGDGDLEMLRYASDSPRRLIVVVEHDDGAREFAYEDGAQDLVAAARAAGWVEVRMSRDFRAVFVGEGS